MNKTIRYMSLTSVLMLAVSSAALALPVAHKNRALPPPYVASSNLKLPAFTSINASGNLYVKVSQQANSKMPEVSIEGKNFKYIVARVKNHTLYLRRVRQIAPNNSPSFVTVKMGALDSITLNNRASLAGNHIKAKHLYINANTSGFINLSGMIDLEKISSYGSGNIRIRWLNSPQLVIYNAGSGNITLSGIAGTVHARLIGHAQLNAQYLRANKIWIQTKNAANAKVLAVNTLRAFALNYSDIYFFKRPQHLTRFTSDSGNVLQLGWRS